MGSDCISSWSLLIFLLYDKCDDFDFDIVNFPFLVGDVYRSTSYGFTFLILFGLLECLVMLLISMAVIEV